MGDDSRRATRPGRKCALTPAASSAGCSSVRHDAADDHADMAEARPRAAPSIKLRHDQVIGRERADADHVDVFFGRQLDDAGIDLPWRRVDHFHAGVAQVRRDDAAAAIVAVEPDLGDQHAGGRVENAVVVMRARPAQRRPAHAKRRSNLPCDLGRSRRPGAVPDRRPVHARRAGTRRARSASRPSGSATSAKSARKRSS